MNVTPAVIAAIATPILGALGLFLWNRGKAAGIAAIDEKLAQAHDDEVRAAETTGMADDDAVKARIASLKAARAAVAAL